MKKIILDLSKPIKDIKISEDTKIFGLFLGKDNMVSINKFNIIFTKTNISLKVNIKAVILDKSVFDFSPKLQILSDQEGIDAELKINILNISSDGYINSTPSMEIFEPNIKASHSLAISHFNDDQLIYLYSKGINKKQAHKLLINSFIADIINEIN
jgi:Fe-S cluster assembly protein SufD